MRKSADGFNAHQLRSLSFRSSNMKKVFRKLKIKRRCAIDKAGYRRLNPARGGVGEGDLYKIDSQVRMCQ